MNVWNITANCEQIVHVLPFQQCPFLHSVIDCKNSDSFVNYLEYLYCTPDETDLGYTPVVQLVILLILLFFLLGTTAGEFLCPALVNISRVFQLSQSVAGVTLLAFGNGAPDVISTMAGVGQNRSSLVIAELFGGAMYICTVVIGLLFIFNDFEVPFILIRDMAFYLGASFWALIIFKRGYVVLSDALGFILLHLVYLITAIALPRIIQRITGTTLFKKVLSQGRLSSDDGYSSEERLDQFTYEPIRVASPTHLSIKTQRRFSSSVSLHRHLENAICTLTSNAEQEIRDRSTRCPSRQSRHNSICEMNHRLSRCPSRGDRVHFFLGSGPHEGSSLLHSNSIKARPTQFIYPRLYTEWQELVLRLWPVEINEWTEMPLCKKLFHLTTYPLLLPLTLTIPLVDEHHRRANWNRTLNVVQCVIVPLFFVLLTKKIDVVVFGTPLWSIAIICGCMIGMLVLATSENHKPPTYHVAFSLIGFIMSLAWIYRLAIEVVSILKAFGIYFSISEEVLGVSVLTWGNYLGDLVTNLSVASQGYPEMALSACLSTSLVALLIGFGSAFSVRFAVLGETSIAVSSSNMLDVIYCSLIGSIVILALGTCYFRFRSSRLLGLILVGYYFTFLGVVFSQEFGLFRLISKRLL